MKWSDVWGFGNTWFVVMGDGIGYGESSSLNCLISRFSVYWWVWLWRSQFRSWFRLWATSIGSRRCGRGSLQGRSFINVRELLNHLSGKEWRPKMLGVPDLDSDRPMVYIPSCGKNWSIVLETDSLHKWNVLTIKWEKKIGYGNTFTRWVRKLSA